MAEGEALLRRLTPHERDLAVNLANMYGDYAVAELHAGRHEAALEWMAKQGGVIFFLSNSGEELLGLIDPRVPRTDPSLLKRYTERRNRRF
jgi:predicted GH43/DUF377 family glycosyl hydrolase